MGGNEVLEMKNEKHDKDKICSLCSGSIKQDDDYYLIQSYIAGDFKGKIFVHKRCFDDVANLKKTAQMAMNKVMEVLS